MADAVELDALWEESRGWPYAAVAFESPKRLPTSLAALARIDPERRTAVCRELTKRFEEVVRGTAAELAVRFGPARAARQLRGVLDRCTLGIGFDSSLRELADDSPALRPLADTLRTSTRLGTPVAPALARLATEVRADVRRRAEARARTIPVRLCFPLVGCVLPAFALLTVVPVVVDGLHG